MPYKLYLDKPEIFECDISVKNASLKGSVARLVVESNDGINFVFKGTIENGKCNIPIRKLKGLLDENSRGNMFLEVIVEDTYFSPWESDFIVEEHTSIKVKVNEQKQSSKPIVEVKNLPTSKSLMKENKSVNLWVPLYEISKLCERFHIVKKTLPARKNDFQQIVNEYFKMNPEFKSQKSTILSNIRHFLK